MASENELIGEVLDMMAVPKWPGVYVLGCFGRYITVYSQQVRALNLAYGLHKTGKLGAETSVAVIGGGAAGLTFTVAAARLGATVTLLEKLHAPMGVQRGSNKRYIHPHIYDWPASESGDNTHLPILDWGADYADAVANQIERQWTDELKRYNGQIIPRWEVRDVSIDPHPFKSRITVTWNDEQKGPQAAEFDQVVLALGFGLESDADGSQYRYWEDDRLDKVGDAKKVCLVSGCGDGGLTDLMRLCIKEFRHDRIVGMFGDHPKSRVIGKRLLEEEERFQTNNDTRSLSNYYQNLNAEHVQQLLTEHKQLRTDTKVYLTARSWWDVFSPKSSILNRFIVSQLARLKAWNWVAGPITLPPTRDEQKRYVVRFGTDAKKERTYDILVMRHGPKPALEEGFPSIWEACRDLADRWRVVPQHQDPTRQRLPWGDVFDPPDTISPLNTQSSTDQYRLVAFDLDGTLLHGEEFIWSWKLVWRHLEYEDAIRARMMSTYLNVKKHTNKEWYKEWCDESAKLFRKKGLKRSDFAAITSELSPVEGLRETIQALKQEGIKIAIVSGGIDIFLQEKIPDYHELFDYVFINKFLFDDQGLFTGVDATRYDFEGKFDAVQDICAREGFGTDQVVFVGDGFNDEHIISRVGLTIGFNPSTVLMRQIPDVRIEDPDLRKILPYVLKGVKPD